jgi:hypothetical protein
MSGLYNLTKDVLVSISWLRISWPLAWILTKEVWSQYPDQGRCDLYILTTDILVSILTKDVLVSLINECLNTVCLRQKVSFYVLSVGCGPSVWTVGPRRWAPSDSPPPPPCLLHLQLRTSYRLASLWHTTFWSNMSVSQQSWERRSSALF